MADKYISNIVAISASSGTTTNYKLKDAEARAAAADTKNAKTTFTSSDVADGSATAWTTVAALANTETHASIFAKISQMFKNIRYLYKLLGTTDISSIGNGTVTGAVSALNSGKAASSHAHGNLTNAGLIGTNTAANKLVSTTTNGALTVSTIQTSQTNKNNTVPSSSLVYSMNETLTSLKTSLESLFIVKKWNWTITISAGYSALYVNSVNLVPIQGYELIYVGASSGHPGRVLIGSIVPQNIITGTTDAYMIYLPCYAKEAQPDDTIYAVAIYKKVL